MEDWLSDDDNIEKWMTARTSAPSDPEHADNSLCVAAAKAAPALVPITAAGAKRTGSAKRTMQA